MSSISKSIHLENTLLVKQGHPPVNKLFSPWLMWSVTVSFVFFQFFLQLSAGVMLHPLMKSFHLTALGGGFLVGSFYFVYVILQTPAGMLVDRFGPRRLLGLGGLICALGCFIFANSHTVSLAFIGRLCMGMGASFAFVSSLYLVAQWFPEQRFATMVGFAETIGMFGTLLGNVYLANALLHVSWRSTMMISTWIALALGLLCYLIVRDKPQDEIDPLRHPQTLEAFYKDVIWIIKHAGLWLNGLYAGLLFSVVTVFAALWIIPYLIQFQHAALPVVTFESALIFVGIAMGGPMMGLIYPKIRNKSRFLCFTALLSSLLSGWILYQTPHSISLCALLFLLLGIICSSYVFNYSMANAIVPKHVRSTSIGFTNTLCVITAPLLQPFVGSLLHYFSSHHSIVGQDIYTSSNYHWALSVIPISLVIAAFIALFLPNPTYSTTSKEVIKL